MRAGVVGEPKALESHISQSFVARLRSGPGSDAVQGIKLLIEIGIMADIPYPSGTDQAGESHQRRAHALCRLTPFLDWLGRQLPAGPIMRLLRVAFAVCGRWCAAWLKHALVPGAAMAGAGWMQAGNDIGGNPQAKEAGQGRVQESAQRSAIQKIRRSKNHQAQKPSGQKCQPNKKGQLLLAIGPFWKSGCGDRI